jgi:hypothetical protein
MFLIGTKWGKELENVLTRILTKNRSNNAGCFLYLLQFLSTGTWFLTAMLHSLANFAILIGMMGLVNPSVMTTSSLSC